MKTRNELLVCLMAAAVALTAAAAFHRFAPGFGIVFKPLLWPLAVLPFTVRARFCLVTSFAVPLVSHALTGMPAWPVALTLSFGASVFAVFLSLGVRAVGRRLRPRTYMK